MQIRAPIEGLRSVDRGDIEPARSEELISVSSATRRIAFAYERFRNILEPDEEDILRRKAIWRILERRLTEDRPPRVTAIALLQELIRAHYIPPVRQSIAAVVAEQLVNAQQIEAHLDDAVADWFLHMVAVSIDRIFYPRFQEETLVHLMYTDTLARSEWLTDAIAAKDQTTQLYVACHRALFAADEYEISFHYFTHQFPAWRGGALDAPAALKIAKELPAFRSGLRKIIEHPTRNRMYNLLRPAAVPYRLVRDIVRARTADAFASAEKLELAARDAITHRLQRTRQRMNKQAWHSILFLFLTKTLVALIIEVPYELALLNRAHFLPLGINIVFHPLLLFFLSTGARLPGQQNTEKLLEQVQKVVTGEGELPTLVISATRNYGALTWTLFTLIYTALFMGIFWSLFVALDWLDFSLLAMALFIMFLGLVSFLAIRIRRLVDLIRVVPQREGAVSTIFSFMTLPVIEFGRFLAQNISQINIALFLMDRVLEAPFKLLIDVTEEWFQFVRDRREEIV